MDPCMHECTCIRMHASIHACRFAAPVVSGAIALILEASSGRAEGQITWRDVQGILATTSYRTDPTDASWTINGAGLHHSVKYGFGLVDVHAATTAASTWWTSYGDELRLTAHEEKGGGVLPLEVHQAGTPLILTLAVAPTEKSEIEHVYVYMDLDHSTRGCTLRLAPCPHVHVHTWLHRWGLGDLLEIYWRSSSPPPWACAHTHTHVHCCGCGYRWRLGDRPHLPHGHRVHSHPGAAARGLGSQRHEARRCVHGRRRRL